MVVIEHVEVRNNSPGDVSLVIEARWLDGVPIVYHIDRIGIRPQEASTRVRPLRKRAIQRFTLIHQQDVWTLLVKTRPGIWRRGWRGIAGWLIPTPPWEELFGDDEIGTAFGVLPAPQVAKALRDMGYSVTEVLWADAVGPTVGVVMSPEG